MSNSRSRARPSRWSLRWRRSPASRASGRALNDDTLDTRKSLERWILPNGLPLGVTDDFEALPRDIRTNVDVLRQFGPAAVVKRRGPSACAQ